MISRCLSASLVPSLARSLPAALSLTSRIAMSAAASSSCGLMKPMHHSDVQQSVPLFGIAPQSASLCSKPQPRRLSLCVRASKDPEAHAPTSIFSKLLGSESPRTLKSSAKVSVVGVGNVGMACAQTCITEDLLDELALVDIQADKLRGEMLDLQHSAAFLPRVKIVADTDYSVTKDSDICIVTAGARQREGEDRLSLLDRNIGLFRKMIPELVRHSPDTILLVVSNPVDILTYISWQLSGLPPNRVIGTGTNLDSSRLRFLVADKFEVNAQNIHGYMVGEHGDSSVPLWSSLTVANVPVLHLYDNEGVRYNKETLKVFHKAVVESAYEVIKLKGYTSWAIGYSAASLVKSLLRDQRRIHPVSVLAKGFYGIDDEVYLSLPAQLGRAGVLGVANLPLADDEVQQLQKSAKAIWDTQSKLKVKE